jgi:NADH:ubiquinone reductase (H+-translocating)
MATIGHLSAVADAFGMKFTGITGYTMWGFVHVLYLVGRGTGQPPFSAGHGR